MDDVGDQDFSPVNFVFHPKSLHFSFGFCYENQMNKREFLMGSAAVVAFPFAAVAKPSIDEGQFEARVIYDDYEEGHLIPTLVAGNTYSTVTGTYRRVGSRVEFSLPLPSLLHSPTTITGLPFTS